MARLSLISPIFLFLAVTLLLFARAQEESSEIKGELSPLAVDHLDAELQVRILIQMLVGAFSNPSSIAPSLKDGTLTSWRLGQLQLP